jgi:hypothetical protein
MECKRADPRNKSSRNISQHPENRHGFEVQNPFYGTKSSKYPNLYYIRYQPSGFESPCKFTHNQQRDIKHHELDKYEMDHIQTMNLSIENWDGNLIISVMYCQPRCRDPRCWWVD